MHQPSQTCITDSVTQKRPSASFALSESGYLTINKDHYSYSLVYKAYAKHKDDHISKRYNQMWGLS